ncbi:thioesterase family protein [Streptomyces qinglanensis]|uniref:Acyl-CoA thioester hydrolase n=1 Tax=Streptomyces qinglanensis TaxID=943816 RepID=A0A1H9WUM6_9ACTN|nr:thioesterase family protein [Streptomyces qinglanensis]SES37103.1 acyl-CoA thioester hydrolase [Streptomyces qinglanensis]
MTRLPLFEQTVRPEWIDYNGHMSEAFYVLVFGHATDAMMDEVGLGPAYREDTGCSLYTVEAHVRYLDEVAEGAPLTVRTRVLGAAGKKLRFAHEMSVGERPVATSELFALHVGAEGSTPFPEAVRARLEALVEEPPEWAGRAVAPVGRAG